MIANGKYLQLDAGWVTALIYYLALKLGIREVSSWAAFGTTPATILATGDSIKIALVGDWGTGPFTNGNIEYPALQVINQVRQLDQTGAVRWSKTTPIKDLSGLFAGLSGGIQGEA